MKKIILLFFCFIIAGCSVPTAASYKEIYGFTRQEQRIKGTLNKTSVSFKDFRENEMYEEDMQALKDEAEQYISRHADLSEEQKNNLRKLKVTAGQNKEEVRLLLGEPDKVMNAGSRTNFNASEIWIYKLSKVRAFTVFIVPVFFPHESYYLYFKNDILVGIERHALRQLVTQSPAAGPFEKKGGSGF